MQVEVNEYNIIKFGLVQLTGNSVEVLLTRAREAEEAGYVLAVEIPDEQVRMNMFDVGQGKPVDEDELLYQDNISNPITGTETDRFTARETTGRKIVVTVEGISEMTENDDVVDGEIVEED